MKPLRMKLLLSAKNIFKNKREDALCLHLSMKTCYILRIITFQNIFEVQIHEHLIWIYAFLRINLYKCELKTLTCNFNLTLSAVLF